MLRSSVVYRLTVVLDSLLLYCDLPGYKCRILRDRYLHSTRQSVQLNKTYEEALPFELIKWIWSSRKELRLRSSDALAEDDGNSVGLDS